MKITKTQLKKIIKEELEASLNEGDQMAKAQELAQVLAQSPLIMAAVEQASQDPKIQAAASGTLTEYDKNLSWTPGQLKPGQTDPMSAKLHGGALAIVAVAGLLSAVPPMVALGITTGVTATAVAILTFNLINKSMGLDQ